MTSIRPFGARKKYMRDAMDTPCGNISTGFDHVLPSADELMSSREGGTSSSRTQEFQPT